MIVGHLSLEIKYREYSLFQFNFIPERNKFHSRASRRRVTRILQVEKNCEVENVTPAELIASNLLSVIVRSTGDFGLEKKICKNDITIETITALIYEHTYDRLNDLSISNDGNGIKHVQD